MRLAELCRIISARARGKEALFAATLGISASSSVPRAVETTALRSRGPNARKELFAIGLGREEPSCIAEMDEGEAD